MKLTTKLLKEMVKEELSSIMSEERYEPDLTSPMSNATPEQLKKAEKMKELKELKRMLAAYEGAEYESPQADSLKDSIVKLEKELGMSPSH